MESKVGVSVDVSVEFRPEIKEQIEKKGPAVVHSNWRTMAKVMRRKAELRPEESSSCVALEVARSYEEEASQIAEVHGLALA